MLRKRALALVGLALLTGFSGCTTRGPLAPAARSDRPETQTTTTTSDRRLGCYAKGGEWSHCLESP
jgi:predicted small lipoprotein YifL